VALALAVAAGALVAAQGPRPGTITVPPSWFSPGTAISITRLSASSTPAMLPPRSASNRGYAVVSKIAPVQITSERRKNTIVSPSVCAAGTWMKRTASPFEKSVHCGVKYVSVGQISVGALVAFIRFSTLRWAMIEARVSEPRGSIESITRT